MSGALRKFALDTFTHAGFGLGYGVGPPFLAAAGACEAEKFRYYSFTHPVLPFDNDTLHQWSSVKAATVPFCPCVAEPTRSASVDGRSRAFSDSGLTQAGRGAPCAAAHTYANAAMLSNNPLPDTRVHLTASSSRRIIGVLCGAVNRLTCCPVLSMAMLPVSAK